MEGCLSFPASCKSRKALKQIEVQYETTQGETKTARPPRNGIPSAYMNLINELEGITFNKRVSKLRWDMAKKRK